MWSKSAFAAGGLLFLMITVPGAARADALAEALFSPAEVAGVTLSPAGDRLAVIKNIGQRQAVYVESTDGHGSFKVFDTNMIETEDTVISGVQWVDNRSLVLGIREWRKAIAELEDTRAAHRVLAVRLKDGNGVQEPEIYALKTSGRVVSPLSREENVFLFARSRSVSKVYRIDIRKLSKLGARLGKTDRIDGGQFVSDNEVASVDGYVFRWLADSSSNILGAVAYTGREEITLRTRPAPAAEWIELKKWDTGDDSDSKDESKKRKGERKDVDAGEEAEDEEDPLYIPIALTGEENVFYALRREEDEPPAVYKYNYENGEAELVYTGPESKILNPLLSGRTHVLYGISVIENGRLKYVYFEDSALGAAEKARARFADSTISVAGADLNERTFVLYVRSPRNPGDFYLYSVDSDRLTHLMAVHPKIGDLKSTEVVSGKVESHGLDVEYFLTLPAHGGNAYPLIVMPHGGPIGVMDFLGFNPAVQYFAQSGYAVLQVNYRGSAGYTEKYLEAGKREFGAKILDDIEAAVDKVKSHRAVDGERICIVGGSYGGYAALMLPIRRPGVYRCAVSLAGVTDVNLFLSSAARPTYTRKWFRDYIGDSREDYEKLKAISPVYSAASLKLPVYLAHGDDDRVVDLEHSYRLKRMLDALGRDYRWRIFEGQGHSFDDHEITVDYYRSIREFVGKAMNTNGKLTAQ